MIVTDDCAYVRLWESEFVGKPFANLDIGNNFFQVHVSNVAYLPRFKSQEVLKSVTASLSSVNKKYRKYCIANQHKQQHGYLLDTWEHILLSTSYWSPGFTQFSKYTLGPFCLQEKHVYLTSHKI